MWVFKGNNMTKPTKIKSKAVLSSNAEPNEKFRHSYLLTLCNSKTATGESHVLLQSTQSNEVVQFPSLTAAFDFLSTLTQQHDSKTVGGAQ